MLTRSSIIVWLICTTVSVFQAQLIPLVKRYIIIILPCRCYSVFTGWWNLLQAMEKNKLFIIDYHDILLPYIRKINSLKGRKFYASRTIFLKTRNGILRPIAIELSLPPSPSNPSRKKVYTHGHDATTNWIWKLAKAHVCTNDAGVHQLVNHW